MVVSTQHTGTRHVRAFRSYNLWDFGYDHISYVYVLEYCTIHFGTWLTLRRVSAICHYNDWSWAQGTTDGPVCLPCHRLWHLTPQSWCLRILTSKHCRIAFARASAVSLICRPILLQLHLGLNASASSPVGNAPERWWQAVMGNCESPSAPVHTFPFSLVV